MTVRELIESARSDGPRRKAAIEEIDRLLASARARLADNDPAAISKLVALIRHSPEVLARSEVFASLATRHRIPDDATLDEAWTLLQSERVLQERIESELNRRANLRPRTKSVTDDQVRDAIARHSTLKAAAEALGIDERQLRRRRQKLQPDI